MTKIYVKSTVGSDYVRLLRPGEGRNILKRKGNLTLIVNNEASFKIHTEERYLGLNVYDQESGKTEKILNAKPRYSHKKKLKELANKLANKLLVYSPVRRLTDKLYAFFDRNTNNSLTLRKNVKKLDFIIDPDDTLDMSKHTYIDSHIVLNRHYVLLAEENLEHTNIIRFPTTEDIYDTIQSCVDETYPVAALKFSIASANNKGLTYALSTILATYFKENKD